MFICCSPSSYNDAETKSTLMFGQRSVAAPCSRPQHLLCSPRRASWALMEVSSLRSPLQGQDH